jgi:hypothetical protein
MHRRSSADWAGGTHPSHVLGVLSAKSSKVKRPMGSPPSEMSRKQRGRWVVAMLSPAINVGA